MLDKYKNYFVDIYDYILKRIELKIDTEMLAGEVFDKFKTEIAFYDVSPEMHKEFILQMCNIAFYARWGKDG